MSSWRQFVYITALRALCDSVDIHNHTMKMQGFPFTTGRSTTIHSKCCRCSYNNYANTILLPATAVLSSEEVSISTKCVYYGTHSERCRCSYTM